MYSDSIDANVLIHGILGDNVEQRKLVAEHLAKPNTAHHISMVAFVETVYVFEKVYQKSRREIMNLLMLFLGRYSEQIVYDRELTAMIFPVWLEHPKLSFVDCLLTAEAEMTNAEPLFTFDKKLANQVSSAKLLK